MSTAISQTSFDRRGPGEKAPLNDEGPFLYCCYAELTFVRCRIVRFVRFVGIEVHASPILGGGTPSLQAALSSDWDAEEARMAILCGNLMGCDFFVGTSDEL